MILNEKQIAMYDDCIFLNEALSTWSPGQLKIVYANLQKAYIKAINKAKNNEAAKQKLNSKFLKIYKRAKTYLAQEDYFNVVGTMRSNLKDILRFIGMITVSGGTGFALSSLGPMGLLLAGAAGGGIGAGSNAMMKKAAESPEGQRICKDYVAFLKQCIAKTK